MPYAPTVNNEFGQIYGRYMVGAAQAQAQGIVDPARIMAEQRRYDAEQMSQGISQATSSFMKSMEGMQQNLQQRDYMKAAMEGLVTKGVVSPETYEKFTKGSLGAQKGMLVDAQANYDLFLKTKLAEEDLQRDVRKNRLILEQQREGLGQSYKKWDEATQSFKDFAIQTGPTSITPYSQAREDISNEPAPIKVRVKLPDGTEVDAFRRARRNPAGYWEPGAGDFIRDAQGNIQPASKSSIAIDWGS